MNKITVDEGGKHELTGWGRHVAGRYVSADPDYQPRHGINIRPLRTSPAVLNRVIAAMTHDLGDDGNCRSHEPCPWAERRKGRIISDQ